MATRMLQRRGTAAEWASVNPILASGEIGFETDTKIIKVGDGVTAWNDLTVPYISSGGGVMTGPLSLVAPTQNAHAARKQDVDTRLPLSGGTLTGALNLIAPTQNAHAARKQDVDPKVNRSGDTMTGPLGLVVPTQPEHGARLANIQRPYFTETRLGAQSIPNNTMTNIVFETMHEGSRAGLFDRAGGVFTALAAAAGFWRVAAQAGFGTNATGRRLLRIRKDLSVRASIRTPSQGEAQTFLNIVSPVLRVVAGTQIEVNVEQTSGTSLDLILGIQNNWISFEFVRPL